MPAIVGSVALETPPAGGVSKATLPTMAGMVVSLSGIFAMIYISSVSERHTGILEERIKRV